MTLVLGLLFVTSTTGQDFHYTQYFMSPLGVNPALAGAFSGSYRLNGIYRDQYRGSAVKPFGGFGINIDAPIIRGIRKQDWVGVGIRMDKDKSGQLSQSMSFSGLTAAYHLGLDKKQTSFISIGAQYGGGSIGYTAVGGEVGNNEVEGKERTEQTNNIFKDNNEGSLNDLSIGVLYTARNAKSGNNFKIGVGVEGILNPNRAVLKQDQKGIGINAFSQYHMEMSKRLSLTSGVLFYSLKKPSAFVINSVVNYRIKPANKFTVHGGLGVRALRAGLIYLGATFNGIRVGLAYDLDLGASTPATGGHKSIELGVSYTGIIHKKPKVKPIIYCPRL
ncbi:MAG: PorP/SprF family type IX secretion system membrane protein [Saprospiraceae bacterium]